MTFEILKKAIDKYKIPYDVKLVSDSGWECGPTEMDGVYYNKEENVICFTQTVSKYEDYDKRCKKINRESGYIAIAGIEVLYTKNGNKIKTI